MSAAPLHPARPPPESTMNDLLGERPVARRFHRAAGSSRVQVVVLAAARLRALHLDPLVTSSGEQYADHPPKKNSGFDRCPGPRLHRETTPSSF